MSPKPREPENENAHLSTGPSFSRHFCELLSSHTAIILERLDKPPVDPDDWMMPDSDPRVAEWLAQTNTTPYEDKLRIAEIPDLEATGRLVAPSEILSVLSR